MKRWAGSIVLAVAVAVALLGCEDAGDRTPLDSGAGDTMAAVQPVVREELIEYDGRERSYRLYLPSGSDPGRPAPVVIVLHGGGGSAERMVRITDFDREAERGGFLAVYPNGVPGYDGAQNWNDGRSDPRFLPAAENVDDVGFIAAILDRLAGERAIDPDRVFATGISNGGMMAYRLGCALAGRIAAIAPVAATMTVSPCTPSQPVSVLHLHGTDDRYVPFEGGRGISRTPSFMLAPVRDVIEFWRAQNGCSAPAEIEHIGTNQEPATRESARGCADGVEVTLTVIQGGGHTWPGGPSVSAATPAGLPPLGMTSSVVHATPLIWEFFAAHPRQP